MFTDYADLGDAGKGLATVAGIYVGSATGAFLGSREDKLLGNKK
jgi:hypothetical protein